MAWPGAIHSNTTYSGPTMVHVSCARASTRHAQRGRSSLARPTHLSTRNTLPYTCRQPALAMPGFSQASDPILMA